AGAVGLAQARARDQRRGQAAHPAQHRRHEVPSLSRVDHQARSLADQRQRGRARALQRPVGGHPNMDIGIGLPSTIPGVTRDQELEWARRADARGFSTLGVIDRIVYSNLEPLIALAAAAAVTERIRLTTSILLGPTRSAALLAKQAASVNLLS